MADWRLIEIEEHDAFMNMALDEACAEAIVRRDVPPTMRFYLWNPDAVSIGYFQGIEDEVNIVKCAEEKVDVVRRRTGGGALYHACAGEIAYSVIAPAQWLPRGITDSYQIICNWIISALQSLNINAEFRPINDIALAAGTKDAQGKTTAGQIISSHAQTRRNGIFLQHGTILYQVDTKKMVSLLKTGQAEISEQMIERKKDGAREQLISLRELRPELQLRDLYHALVNEFRRGKKVEWGEWTLAELARAQELAENKYSQRDWNELR
jgi:lipoate-protein ligase A